MSSCGFRSIVTSLEASEDNPLLGTEELEKICEGKKKVVFIGISCGLSAPFIAGQLDFCMRNLDIFLPVLVGFNPVSMARNDHIEGWHSTFQQVADRMQKLHDTRRAFVLNPAVGPEGISGSSRMKGGSATKILLETIFLVAHKADSNVPVTEKCLLEILRTYERAHKVTYSQSKKIGALVKQAATRCKCPPEGSTVIGTLLGNDTSVPITVKPDYLQQATYNWSAQLQSSKATNRSGLKHIPASAQVAQSVAHS
ncbi:hypothetical protein FKM82_010027 [Ascaphus truei]